MEREGMRSESDLCDRCYGPNDHHNDLTSCVRNLCERVEALEALSKATIVHPEPAEPSPPDIMDTLGRVISKLGRSVERDLDEMERKE